jgi:hypothetical protein
VRRKSNLFRTVSRKVALAKSLTASTRDRPAPAASAIALDGRHFVWRYASAKTERRLRAWPPRDILAIPVIVADFCALVAAAAAVFAVYFNVLNLSATEPRLYVLPALFAATLFVGGYPPRRAAASIPALRFYPSFTRHWIASSLSRGASDR